MVAAILEGGRVTIDVARLRELHQPMYGHTGDPCSWCREWTPCPVTELLDAYEERDRLRAALNESCKWLQRLAEAYDPEDTEKGKPAIDALRRADMDGYRNACGLDAALEGRE